MGKAVEDVSDADREQTKRVVYSVMYGIGKYFYIAFKCLYTPNPKGGGAYTGFMYFVSSICLHLTHSRNPAQIEEYSSNFAQSFT